MAKITHNLTILTLFDCIDGDGDGTERWNYLLTKKWIKSYRKKGDARKGLQVDAKGSGIVFQICQIITSKLERLDILLVVGGVKKIQNLKNTYDCRHSKKSRSFVLYTSTLSIKR
jgi:hypothetical protein